MTLAGIIGKTIERTSMAPIMWGTQRVLKGRQLQWYLKKIIVLMSEVVFRNLLLSYNVCELFAIPNCNNEISTSNFIVDCIMLPDPSKLNNYTCILINNVIIFLVAIHKHLLICRHLNSHLTNNKCFSVSVMSLCGLNSLIFKSIKVLKG